MKLRKICLFLMMVVMLCACSGGGSQTKGIYDGLDAKAAYEKFVEKMNTEVTYFASSYGGDGFENRNQSFVIDGKVTALVKTYVEQEDFKGIMYNVIKDGKMYSIDIDDVEKNTYKYNEMSISDKEYTHPTEIFSDFYKNERYTVDDITKTDNENGTIVLSLKITYTDSEGKDAYLVSELTTNEEGYLAREKVTYYTDKNYSEGAEVRFDNKFSNYNKKTADDLNKEIEAMKDLDGLTYDEIIAKIGDK